MNRRKGALVAALSATATLAAVVPAASATVPDQGRTDHHAVPGLQSVDPQWRDVPGWIYAIPRHVVESSFGGQISFVVTGNQLPRLQHFTLHSPSLDAGCRHGNTLEGRMVVSDWNGRFNTPAVARGCVNGVYLIEASEHFPPFKTYITSLVIEQPHGGPPHPHPHPHPHQHPDFHPHRA
ncbi:hypothetical protein NGB36_07675 [Streptomyces sp. RB6PN25]|uniref:Uncharacterized protein n=1 Tax=Streptomyces humicola TaxID=2953240 RepID=A0ABT1PTN2_9ACTN|nr:hypothetical protein [Streptomyces humicola]MCQ4080483.1 hypothetical protein [Streptomyces humicola]